ncbi:MAG: endonuclease/exonuclease/phosphatase family protein [Gammaproteobacteria bacterium]
MAISKRPREKPFFEHSRVLPRLSGLFLVYLLSTGLARPDDAASCSNLQTVAGAPAAATPSPRHPFLTVASLNLARENRTERVIGELRRLQQRLELDILLLQEVDQEPGNQGLLVARVAEALGHYCVFAPADLWRNGGLHGLAILSRWPLAEIEVVPLRQFNLRFRKRCRIGLAVTAATPHGPARVFNLHLDSRINTGERLQQLAPILRSAEQFAGDCLIGGDFNTADFRWFRRWMPLPYGARQSNAVRRELAERGFQTPLESTGATFKYLGLKLDWIFLRGLSPMACGVEKIGFSDHRAVWARMAVPGAPRSPDKSPTIRPVESNAAPASLSQP